MPAIGPSGPSNPYLVNRAYGVAGAGAAQPSGVVARIGRAEEPGAASSREATGLERLVAGVVPGRVDFSGAAPAPKADALPFYRRPGDRNEAATAWQAGQTLDVSG